MTEQNITPETEETPEVEAHSSDVLGLQKLQKRLDYNSPVVAFSCSSCGAMSC
jgi:hypothetical protein